MGPGMKLTGLKMQVESSRDEGSASVLGKLSWSPENFAIYYRSLEDQAPEPVYKLEGTLADRRFTLVIDNDKVSRDAQGGFRKILNAESRKQEVQVVLVDEQGEVSARTFVLKQPAELTEVSGGNWISSAGLGVTSLTYDQTRRDGFSQLNLTVKAQVRRWLIRGVLDASASAFYNLVPVSSSSPTDRIRFLGANIRAGYSVPGLNDPWGLTLNAGYYYLTTFASGNFGFVNVGGPSLYPVLRRSLGGARMVYLYGKFSPISESLGFLSLDSNELAFGSGYTFPFLERIFTLGLDISRLDLRLGSIRVQSNSYSLGLSTNL